ncbi:hypothetical protein P5V15_012907 [Pogonomyrmex californicus]
MESNWIESLRTKLVGTDTTTLKQLLQSNAGIVGEIKKSQQLNKDETKIEESMAKLATIKEIICMETQTLEQKNNELSNEKGYLKELEVEKKQLLQEIKQLEEKCSSMKSFKPNLHDERLLEQGKKKLKLYKDLTKIQWDYEIIKHDIKGYVSNKRDYIHHFCHKSQETNDKLFDSLWHEIYLSTSGDKENLEPTSHLT